MTPCTVACRDIIQARILESVAFPSPGDLPELQIEPASPALAGRFFTLRHLSSSCFNVSSGYLAAALEMFLYSASREEA